MSTPTKKKRKFVKYANRKVHEIGSEEPYVSMDDVAAFVRAGDDVEVTDDATGKDITAATLARIVYDTCRTEDWKAATIAVGALQDRLPKAA